MTSSSVKTLVESICSVMLPKFLLKVKKSQKTGPANLEDDNEIWTAEKRVRIWQESWMKSLNVDG